jgi:hypothetical protein
MYLPLAWRTSGAPLHSRGSGGEELSLELEQLEGKPGPQLTATQTATQLI